MLQLGWTIFEKRGLEVGLYTCTFEKMGRLNRQTAWKEARES